MQEPTSLRFLGAAQTVTGSTFLIQGHAGRVLIDCGMYQGSRELRRRNWATFPVAGHDIDAVVLSHAHLDHCGWLPRLVRRGFNGPVHCSPWTAKVAAIVLRDAAHLQEEEAEYAALRGYSKRRPPLPLFDTTDAERAISLFRELDHGALKQIAPRLSVRLHRAGHILGSSTVEAQAAGRTVVFSGDLGRDSHPLLNPPDPLPEADVVVVESTYGDQVHGPRRADDIAEPIRSALAGELHLVPGKEESKRLNQPHRPSIIATTSSPGSNQRRRLRRPATSYTASWKPPTPCPTASTPSLAGAPSFLSTPSAF
ncbi:hypothetical protein Rhe02_59410 [Rhizocola hellebori]|uniref:Metallo-beta-lactamase domain-containing protein n=1 Tax=Rhizocola hellebori TaxID=1392758 RepID=A0A8J3QBT7_9ACTN|nr:hypothetical protein Rhe02_59410 [Rhizocola hellebori]